MSRNTEMLNDLHDTKYQPINIPIAACYLLTKQRKNKVSTIMRKMMTNMVPPFASWSSVAISKVHEFVPDTRAKHSQRVTIQASRRLAKSSEYKSRTLHRSACKGGTLNGRSSESGSHRCQDKEEQGLHL